MLIAFSGLKGSGKDTAANVLISEYGFTKIAFADAVREVALAIDPKVPFKHSWGSDIVSLSQLVIQFGWDKIKREVPEVRRLLQVVGTEAGRMILGENVWVDILDKRFPDIDDDSTKYVITDCRFDNEVDFVRTKGGLLVWVDRPGLQSDGHASESEHIKDLASVILHNDETKEELEEDVRFMLFMRGYDRIESGITT
jgi:hypothetical protein